jgi:pimeloyl-ACP methyl ester carboxylesterase
MKRLLLCLVFLTLTISACGIADQEPTPVPDPTVRPVDPTSSLLPPTQPAGESESRCGDGVCDGPETAENCPEDCAAATADPQPTPVSAEVDARSGEEAGTYWVTNPTSGVELFTRVMRPDDWDGEPLPTLVIIPGGTDPGSAITEGEISRRALERGFVVVAFDPEGRGNSDGEETYSGFTHQDGLATVISFAAALPEVDAERMGMISFSYGVTLASGVLARYPELPIRFYIDWEGPADRRDTTLGCTPSRNYDWPPCDDDEAWAQREAVTFIAQVEIPYQRVQMANDHAQPDVSHAVNMVNAAVEGAPPWVRLNNYAPNETYDPDNPPAMLPNRSEVSLDERLLNTAEEMLEMTETSGTNTDVTPVYVTVATHVEEQLPLPCGESPSDRCCQEYDRFRANLIAYADLFLEYGVKWNLQPNVELLRLTDLCETDELRAETTDGQSILPYLIDEKSVMVDAHAHPHQGHNYADVMEQLHLYGVPQEMLTVVGGCYTGEAEQLTTFEAGWQGEAFPDVVWRPLLYTFPAVVGHPVEAEDYSSGMWKPAGFDWNPLEGEMGDLYYTHDPSRRMAMVGSGFVHSCALGHDQAYFYYASDYVEQLVAYIESGRAPGDRLYTASIATNQQHTDDPETYLPTVEAQLQALQDEVDAGKVIYVHYQELLEIWETEYGSQPNTFRLDQFDRADFTCDGEGHQIP